MIVDFFKGSLKDFPLLWLTPVLFLSIDCKSDYSQHPKAQEFIKRFAAEHQFDPTELSAILAQAEKKQSILDAIAKPAEKTLTWAEYQDIFLNDKRINQGVEFWQENDQTLMEVSQEFGVPKEIIVAIIGVETYYGRLKGSYRVLDALSTLGFDYPPREKFFAGELEHFLLLAKEQKQDPVKLLGSYAGAMGYGQFIPSSYRAYAIDFDGDEIADIWNNPIDALASVANYFNKHGWRPGGEIVTRAHISDDYDKEILNDKNKPTLTIQELKQKGYIPVTQLGEVNATANALVYDGKYGKEFWLGFDNFYVITRYNRSLLYAMAVYQLSERIKAEYLLHKPENSNLVKSEF